MGPNTRLAARCQGGLVYVVPIMILFSISCYFECWLAQVYMKAAALDLERRFHFECDLLALLGSAALTEVPTSCSINRNTRSSIFAGAQLDMADPGTVSALHALRRVTRFFGRPWSLRLQVYLSLLMAMILVTTLITVVISYLKKERDWEA